MHASPPAFQHTGTEYESAFQQPLGEAMASGGWQAMLAAMGATMAESVRQTLDGLNELARCRRIGVYEARWMREPLQQLYESGIAAQRLSNLAHRHLPPAHEAVALHEVIEEAVADHRLRRSGHRILCQLDPVDVMSEPEALVSVAGALLSWGCSLGRELDLQLTHQPGKERATLTLRVGKLHDAQAGDAHQDSVEWLLLWQLARLEGIKVWRSVTAGRVRAMLEFSRAMQRHCGMAVLESGPDVLYAPEAGNTSTMWCVAPPGTVAADLPATLAPHVVVGRVMGSVAALHAELPDAPDCVLSTREILGSAAFRQWRHQAQSLRGRCVAAVEICTDDGVFEIGGFGPDSLARISSGTLTPKLLGAVVSEMGRLAEAMP